MTWKAVYETATGKLRSIGTVVADPLPDGVDSSTIVVWRIDGELQSLVTDIPAVEDIPFGHSYEELTDRSLLEKFRWNDATKAFDLPAPAQVKVWSPVEFLQRFTAAERKTIRQLAKNNADLDDYLYLIGMAGEIRSDHVLVTQGLASLVAGGIITQARADEIAGG